MLQAGVKEIERPLCRSLRVTVQKYISMEFSCSVFQMVHHPYKTRSVHFQEIASSIVDCQNMN